MTHESAPKAERESRSERRGFDAVNNARHTRAVSKQLRLCALLATQIANALPKNFGMEATLLGGGTPLAEVLDGAPDGWCNDATIQEVGGYQTCTLQCS